MFIFAMITTLRYQLFSDVTWAPWNASSIARHRARRDSGEKYHKNARPKTPARNELMTKWGIYKGGIWRHTEKETNAVANLNDVTERIGRGVQHTTCGLTEGEKEHINHNIS
jgi:hypothetical protein